jgi:serine/threonine-protein kinase HipA
MSTSERRARDRRAYVYLQMPQSLEIVTAGYYELDFPQGVATGSFVYSPIYLAREDALPIEPYELPLSPRRKTTVHLKGIFGALRDASPDAWGRRIIEKHTGRVDLSEVDYLLHSAEDRAGALSFGRGKTPPGPLRDFNQVVQLEALLAAAEAFLEQEHAGAQDIPEQMFELLHPGTSMGGARPKNVVEDGDGLWLAKFPDRGDRWNNARVEGAMLALAAECGIHTAAYRIQGVAGKDVLLVKRFDRTRTDEGYLRHRMVSGLTLLGAEDTYGDRGKWSYLLLADEVRRRSARPAEDLAELFRRMAFNALISNTDDHPRNHALLAPTEKWELSPAYDLTPNPLVSQEKRDLAMACGRFNRYANRTNLLSEHAQFKLSLDQARALVDQVQRVVAARWLPVLRQHGATETDCDRLAPAFNYPGFELDPATVLAAAG